MVLFEQLLDELAKEAKEAPGWFSLIMVCNLLPLSLLVPGFDGILERLAIDVHHEHNSIATLIAISLFFLGDCLDTLLFPRKDGGGKAEKLLHSIMLPWAAWAAFFTVQRSWFAGAFLWVLWVVPFPIYRRLREQHSNRDRVGSGCNWLIQPPRLRQRLERAQQCAKGKLRLQKGIYPVAKALARTAGIYNPWIMVQNESSKFVRSAVIPLVVWTFWLLGHGRWPWAMAAGIGAIAALLLYGSLKALHMCLLYERAPALDGYRAEDVPEGLRVFFWNAGSDRKPKYKLIGGGEP